MKTETDCEFDSNDFLRKMSDKLKAVYPTDAIFINTIWLNEDDTATIMYDFDDGYLDEITMTAPAKELMSILDLPLDDMRKNFIVKHIVGYARQRKKESQQTIEDEEHELQVC